MLIATDFSPAATHAAEYACCLASYTGQDLLLIHVFSVPRPMVAEGTAMLISDLYERAEAESLSSLDALKVHLMREISANAIDTGFMPEISVVSVIGKAEMTIQSFFSEHEISMVVLGINPGRRNLPRLMGSILHHLIKRGVMPLLLVPANYCFKPVKRIVFSSNLLASEIVLMAMVNHILSAFNSELLIFHHSQSDDEQSSPLKTAEAFLNRVCQQLDFSRIYYHPANGQSLELELADFLDQQLADMLVMVHRQHSFVGQLFGQDRTLLMVARTEVPLLILPGHYVNQSNKDR